MICFARLKLYIYFSCLSSGGFIYFFSFIYWNLILFKVWKVCLMIWCSFSTYLPFLINFSTHFSYKHSLRKHKSRHIGAVIPEYLYLPYYTGYIYYLHILFLYFYFFFCYYQLFLVYFSLLKVRYCFTADEQKKIHLRFKISTFNDP